MERSRIDRAANNREPVVLDVRNYGMPLAAGMTIDVEFAVDGAQTTTETITLAAPLGFYQSLGFEVVSFGTTYEKPLE